VPNQIEHPSPAAHPTAAGHFPGNPVIPGAVLLDAVLQAIYGCETGACRIQSAKFLYPVRPGDVVSIRWTDGAGTTRFNCVVGDRPVLTGSVRR